MNLRSSIASSAAAAILGGFALGGAAAHHAHASPQNTTCKTVITNTTGSTTTYSYTKWENKWSCTGHGYIEHMKKNDTYFSGALSYETFFKDSYTNYPCWTSQETLEKISKTGKVTWTDTSKSGC